MNKIVICPNNLKLELIKTQDLLDSVKYMSKKELIDGLTFSYDLNAILYVHNKLNLSFENSKELIDNLKVIPLLNNESLAISKLNELNDLYYELLNKGLITTHPLFNRLFIDKEVVIYGYSKLDKELVTYLNILNVKYEYSNISYLEFKHKILEFSSIDEEVRYVFNEIASLINQGVSLNNIYLYEYSEEYNLLIEKYQKYLNIPIDNDYVSLGKSQVFLKFLKFYKDNSYDLKDAYDIYSKGISDETERNILYAILNVIIQIPSLDKDDSIKLLSFLVKGKDIKIKKYLNTIKIANESTILKDDDYLFILGFQTSSFPKAYKDNDYLNDEIKNKLNLNSSVDLIAINKERVSNIIKHTKNLVITYKVKMGKNRYLVPSFINLEIEKGTNDSTRYSKDLAFMEVATYKDQYRLYDEDNPYMNAFTDSELGYLEYDNKYKKIENFKVDNLALSYTQINEYNKCPFMYYVKRILKANIFEDRFETKLGNVYHHLLERSVKENILLNEDDITKAINDNFVSEKDKFFASTLLPQAIKVVKKNQEFLIHTKYKKEIAEEELKAIFDDVCLVGKIDKIMIDEDNLKALVIDYKTGDFSFDIDKAKHGVDMQLAIYLRLLKSVYPDLDVSGIYIQNVCVKEIDNDSYRLDGLTINDEEIIKNIDNELGLDNKKSRFVRDIKCTNNGIKSKDSNTFELFDDLNNLASLEVKKVSKGIKNADFTISPIMFANERLLPCRFCPCLDICFRTDKDIRLIEKEEENYGSI